MNLHELQAKRRTLADERRRLVEYHERMIASTNKQFDRLMLEVGREIATLEAREEPVTPAPAPAPERKRARSKKPTITITVADGYTQEEVDHFNALQRG